jgi:hypothetical protein
MGIQRKSMGRIINLLLVIFIITTPYTAYASEEDTKQALQRVKTLVMIEGEDQIFPLINRFEQMNIPCCNTQEKRRYVLNILRLQSYGNKLTEFIDTVNLLFSFYPEDYQRQFSDQWQQAIGILDDFRKQVNSVVRDFHPGLQLSAQKLRKKYSGKGVKIAVFDLFDEELLAKQRFVYPKARIGKNQAFGDPVSLSHGNSVIDIILNIAPGAQIIPISSDSQSYNQAMQYLTTREEIPIINMSRTFLEQENKLDSQFKELLNQLLKTKIIAKSLGNTGTDIDGNLTLLREQQGLPPVGNLFAYDLALIKEFIQSGENTRNLLFALNFNLIKENIALSATIPGNNPGIIAQTLSVPADGLFTWSTDNYESGSSFAAPQLAGVSALLWQAMTEAGKTPTALAITSSLIQSAQPIAKLPFEAQGTGLIQGDEALKVLHIQK